MKNQRLILITTAAAIIVIILAALLNTLLATTTFKITNFDQINSGFSSSQINKLQDYIWQSLQRTQNLNQENTEISALIRPNSFTKTTHETITNYSFLIDIDGLKATFVVSFALVQDKDFYESPVVDCPLPSEMKYPDTNCRSEKSSTLSVSVGQYLPYYFHLDSGELVTVTRGINYDNTDYLNVRVSSCGDNNIIEQSKTGVQNWLSSLNLPIDKYNINIPEFCDGGH